MLQGEHLIRQRVHNATSNLWAHQWCLPESVSVVIDRECVESLLYFSLSLPEVPSGKIFLFQHHLVTRKQEAMSLFLHMDILTHMYRTYAET